MKFTSTPRTRSALAIRPFRVVALPIAFSTAALLFSTTACSAPSADGTTGSLTIKADKPGAKISTMLCGIFFEEINRAGDGGLYAEMVQNRSFEDADFPIAWKANNADLALDRSVPINDRNPTSIKVTANAGGGILNSGFIAGGPQHDRGAWDRYQNNNPGDIAVAKGKTYDLSVYVRAEGSPVLKAELIGQDGTALASQTLKNVGKGWQKVSVSLASSATDHHARLSITSDKATTFWLDMVSLFPKDTWKGRKNGLRADLMERVVAMKPAFVRFPGGCYVEGDEIANRFRWKDSIGDIAERPGHWNLWGYRSTDGLGLHEYLQMSEDLGAEPLFVVNAGMSHHEGRLNGWAEPMEKMGEYVQDAVDAIEYANGPVTSKWGALRAKNGHPKPFDMKMIQIGNENWGPEYVERYALFYDAIKAKYPDMVIVGDGTIHVSHPMDIEDTHIYADVPTFLQRSTEFDTRDRKSGRKIYVGEYAVTIGAGTGSLRAALGEAAYLTGIERNGDLVTMCSYAPLLVRTGWRAWNPNAIVFDQNRSYGTPSYWLQTMFSQNRATVNLPIKLELPAPVAQPIQGKIGVGTWNGTAEFKDIKVTQNGKTLLESDFTKDLNGFTSVRGQWTTQDGVLRQTNSGGDSLALAGDANWTDYTLTLKARKLGGKEGFLITFGSQEPQEKSWWNIGGWDNQGSAVEAVGIDSPRTPNTVETGKWYDVKIEVKGTRARFYLDGALIHDTSRKPIESNMAVAGLDETTGETILKFVNTSAVPATVAIAVDGASGKSIKGKRWIMTSADAHDENSYEEPNKIVPKQEDFSASSSRFTQTFAANSVTVIRWK
eukprot:TRINITY_DN942_c0_g1_i1.p1 TRINITY_DN942_c0_g1~~TRINITY_DN942_c0_g1_i1.p1  ORF type:complete len:832 (+),score=215.34 TRINITY_DN942_c0_g1_i1:2147-4642(+)